ncbi:PREDICTED: flavonol synthase/flavanone 3-hydroxylase [Tarenaya hassleriana]|uniref:flavonol synthase/flavanone 3-hydroxylase n=1 Tax=Tarenaya hassleriana TaxID=28532 RepID=UPI00053C5D68|nr:PREDICTED: flavonol synthase/flavanone 3-hydroxylase [Tarenaya hassleriana]
MEVERVQDIASSSLLSDAIPSEFIRSEKEQPLITTYRGPAPKIPVIDLADPDEERVARAVVEASREWGIFQVVNHGIPAELIRRLQEVGKQFFELPAADKEAVAKPADAKDIEGYGTKLQKDLEGKKAWVDHLFHRIWPPNRINYRFWPNNPPEYREVNEEYAGHVKMLSERIMGWLSEGLGLRREALKEGIGGEAAEYMMKINYYPPCPRPDLALGVPAHTDLSALTLLVPNEVPGLQVFKDDHWFDAEYIPSAVIVHIGDQILRLSNGAYKNVLHRTTVDKEKTRMSWPVFVEPKADMVVGPLPELTGGDNPPKFKPFAFMDYSYRKLNKLPLD